MAQPLPEPWVLCGMFQWESGPYRLGVRLTVDTLEVSGLTLATDTTPAMEYSWFDADGDRCELPEE